MLPEFTLRKEMYTPPRKNDPASQNYKTTPMTIKHADKFTLINTASINYNTKTIRECFQKKKKNACYIHCAKPYIVSHRNKIEGCLALYEWNRVPRCSKRTAKGRLPQNEPLGQKDYFKLKVIKTQQTLETSRPPPQIPKST